MKKSARLQVLKTHGILFVAGFIALAAAGAATNEALNANLTNVGLDGVDIAVEHSVPVHLTLNMSSLRGRGLVEISHDADETVKISLPSDWLRREVKYVSLSAIQPDPPTFGFTRWRFPAGSRVTFEAPVAPQHVLMHNPSAVPLRVTYTHVDLETEQTIHDSLFVQDSAVRLW